MDLLLNTKNSTVRLSEQNREYSTNKRGKQKQYKTLIKSRGV
jgi:hypothetical protein